MLRLVHDIVGPIEPAGPSPKFGAPRYPMQRNVDAYITDADLEGDFEAFSKTTLKPLATALANDMKRSGAYCSYELWAPGADGKFTNQRYDGLNMRGFIGEQIGFDLKVRTVIRFDVCFSQKQHAKLEAVG